MKTYVSILVLASVLAACSASQGRRGSSPLLPQSEIRTPAARNYRVLYRFRGNTDGSLPTGVISVGGILYGTTGNGGVPRACAPTGCGTIFSIDMSGRHENIIYRFKGVPNGSGPISPLLYRDGAFYGTTAEGGTKGCTVGSCGIVFSVNTAGRERILYRFPGGKGGGVPNGGVIGSRGMLFGTTEFGGQERYCVNECVTAFSVDPKSGAERVLHYFRGGRDGFLPIGQLVAVGDTLFGLTQSGGRGWPGGYGCCGTVFSVTATGDEQILYRFSLGHEGDTPLGGGLVSVHGVLYGMTSGGGDGFGAVFAVTQTGAERIVYRFQGSGDGSSPNGTLVWDGSTFYGTAAVGGLVTKACRYGCGTLFSLTPSGQLTILHRFAGGNDGIYPGPNLLLFNNTLYGVTEFGGGTGCKRAGAGCGTIFALRLSRS